jgi:hypothetical protein
MFDSSQSWSLFGYDVRRPFFVFTGAWRDFLWSDGSPVRAALDETVTLLDDGETAHYRAGQSAAAESTASTAIRLPDELVLAKVLELPPGVEGDLESAITLEVAACSPFPADDTCFGWSVSHRTPARLVVQLVICSRSAVMEYLAGEYDCHDVGRYEVWAAVNDTFQVVSGFGEAARERRYSRRLWRTALRIGYCAAALVALAALGAGFKYLEARKMESLYREAQTAAAAAVEHRDKLSAGNALLDAANTQLAGSPDVYQELVRLSRALDDATWLTQVDIKNGTMRIDGQSPNAARVMQQLTDEPAYAEVTAPAAIRTVGRSGLERFVLDIRFADTQETP